MICTKLRGSKFKGRDFEHDLAPITVFVGPNSAGKSARLEALQLALAGFVPGVPASPTGIYGAFGGQGDMTVGAILEDVRHTQILKSELGYDAAAATYSMNGGVIRSFRPKGKSVSREDRWDKLPVDWAVAPVAVDADEYMKTTERERTRILFRMAKLGREITADTITAEIKNIVLETNTKQTQEFIGRLCNSVENTFKAKQEIVQEWLIATVETFREKLKSANDNVKRMNLTVQGITQLRAAAPPPESSMQDVERRLAQAREQETQLSTELGRLEQQITAAKRQQDGKARIEGELNGPLSDCKHLLDKAEPKLYEIVKKHGQKPDVYATQTRMAEVEREGKRIRAEIDQLEWKITEKRNQHAAKLKHDACPYCGTDVPDWKQKIQAEHDVELHNLSIEKAKKDDQRTPLKTEYETLKQRLAAIDPEVTSWQAEENSITVLRETVSAYKTQLVRRGDALTALADIKVVDVTEAQKAHADTTVALKGVREVRTVLDADRIRLSAERTEALQKIQAGENAQNALNEVSILKEALEKVETLCQELVNESINPLIAKVNALCEIIMPAPLEFVNGEIGWRENGVWISKAKQLGGARRTLLFASLSVALSEPGGIVIIDEMANIDPQNSKLVVQHFEDLIRRGVIGQVAMADPTLHRGQWAWCKSIKVIEV